MFETRRQRSFASPHISEGRYFVSSGSIHKRTKTIAAHAINSLPPLPNGTVADCRGAVDVDAGLCQRSQLFETVFTQLLEDCLSRLRLTALLIGIARGHVPAVAASLS